MRNFLDFSSAMTSFPPKTPNFIIISVIFAKTRGIRGKNAMGVDHLVDLGENIKKLEISYIFLPL